MTVEDNNNTSSSGSNGYLPSPGARRVMLDFSDSARELMMQPQSNQSSMSSFSHTHNAGMVATGTGTPRAGGKRLSLPSTPIATGSGHGARRVPSSASSAGATPRRGSFGFMGLPPTTPTGSTTPITPLSYAGQRRKLSSKFVGRLSVFENSNPEMQLETTDSGEGSETGSPSADKSQLLSPTSSSMQHRTSIEKINKRTSKAGQIIQKLNENSLTSPQKAVPDSDLMSPSQVKQLIAKTSNHRRVVQYEQTSSASPRNKKSPVMLLTPKEVRSLIRSSSKKLHTIVNTYEQKIHRHQLQLKRNGSSSHDMTDDGTYLEPNVTKSAKRRQRQRTGTEALSERVEQRQHHQQTHTPSTPQNNPAMAALQGNSVDAVFENVQAKSFDFTHFIPPSFNDPDKTSRQRALIERTVQENFVFSEFRSNGKARNETTLQMLVDAFEPFTVEQAITIVSQGDATQDHFYIVEEGQVDFQVDGKTIGSATAGTCFGEQALLHQATPNATVVASASQGAKLLRLDQKSYRGILQMHVMEAEALKRKVVEGIDFLKPLLEEDPSLVGRLAGLLTRQELTKGDSFEFHEDQSFHVVFKGGLKLCNSKGTLDIDLAKGDFFGERAILGTLKRRSSSSVTMTAESDGGVLYSVDRVALENALGTDRLQQLQDLHSFGKSSQFKSMKVELTNTKGRLAGQIRKKRFERKGEDILQEERPGSPAMYVVREGAARVTFTGSDGQVQEKTVFTGEVFGDENLQTESTARNGKKVVRCDKDFAAKTTGDDPVTVGILPLKDIKIADNEEATKTSSGEMDYVGGDIVSFQLRNKIRESVKTNIGLNDLERISMLGEGQFGEVWLVSADVFKAGVDSLKQKFALKSQHKMDDIRGSDTIDAIRREIDIMDAINHPGIVNLVNTYEDDNSIYMLMGLVPGGELWNIIHEEDAEGNWTAGVPEAHAKFYTLAIADTLAFMHRRQYVFRDLKPENVMIDEDGYPVIVDFGFGKHCPNNQTFTFCGTPNYVAPEIITHSGHGSAVDYWALGVTLYEMITGENPFWYDGLDQMSLYSVICREPFYPLSDDTSDALKDIIHKLLEKEPTQRLGSLAGGFDDISNHEWFADLDLHQLRAKALPAPWKPDTGEEELDEEAVEDLMASFSILGATPMMIPSLGHSFHFEEIREEESDDDQSMELSFETEDASFCIGEDSGTSMAGAEDEQDVTEVVKGEVAKDEVAKDEVAKDEVVKDEVVKDEVVKDEVVKDENHSEPTTPIEGALSPIGGSTFGGTALDDSERSTLSGKSSLILPRRLAATPKRQSRLQREEERKARRSTIKDTLAGLGIGDPMDNLDFDMEN